MYGATKRRILEIVFLNGRLDGATLVLEMRRPICVLAKGLTSENSRGDWTPIELFRRELASWSSQLRRIVQGVSDAKHGV